MTSYTLNEAVDLTEEGAKYPAFREVVDEVDPTARQRDGEIGDSQVDEIIVGRLVHSLASYYGRYHKNVADNRDNHDRREENTFHGCLADWNALGRTRVRDHPRVDAGNSRFVDGVHERMRKLLMLRTRCSVEF